MLVAIGSILVFIGTRFRLFFRLNRSPQVCEPYQSFFFPWLKIKKRHCAPILNVTPPRLHGCHTIGLQANRKSQKEIPEIIQRPWKRREVGINLLRFNFLAEFCELGSS
jgi:hypothetical protein